jgi:glycosyltransferase involved in cell wall biosynthesis
LPKIIEKYPHFRAVINLIPGRRSHVIRQMIDELGIQEYVTLFDGLDQDDLIYYIAASDIVFVPSLSDGF